MLSMRFPSNIYCVHVSVCCSVGITVVGYIGKYLTMHCR